VFITNNFTITTEEVALIYKKRWGIEILFKKMKQNFQLQYFYGENENAIRTQVWCTLIAQIIVDRVAEHGQGKEGLFRWWPHWCVSI
jgi:IS4 transposase